MRILFTICARSGSKGFKNKNLKLFLGQPLVFYTVAGIKLYCERFIRNDEIDIALNTDCYELIDIINNQNSLKIDVIDRKKELAGDVVSKVAVIRDTMIQMQIKEKKTYDMVIDLDITSPLRTVNNIKALIDKFSDKNEYDVITSVTPSRRNPYFNMLIEEEGYFCKVIMSDFTSRQQAPEMYDMNASMYAYLPNALMNKSISSFFNDNVGVVVMKDTAVLDIDSEEDYELMQVVAQYLVEKEAGINEVFKEATRINELKTKLV